MALTEVRDIGPAASVGPAAVHVGPWRRTRYCLGAFPRVVVAFVLAVTGFAIGVSTVVLVAGIPVLVVTVDLARGVAHLERVRLAGGLGRSCATPAYSQAAAGASPWQRWRVRLADPQSWLDLLWILVGFVTGTTAFCVVCRGERARPAG